MFECLREKQVPKRTEKKRLEWTILARNLQQQFRLPLSARNCTPHINQIYKWETHFPTRSRVN